MPTETCYMCADNSVSAEHVPPRCLFPEKKDLPPGVNYRKDLITVPSCDEHNSKNSLDDEYLLAVVAAHFENNCVATDHFQTKIRRALVRSQPLAQTLLKNVKPATLDGQPTVAFEVDRPRFDKSMARAARGLYFHEKGKKWEREAMHVHSSALRDGALSKSAELGRFEQLMESFNIGKGWSGANPDVFQYRLAVEGQRLIVSIQFYRGMDVWVLSGPGLEMV